jgi:GH24 family phage-related lysozyme (muramidase)
MDAFVKTQSQWEGVESEMYTDILGLVTTAIGYLIDDKSGINGYGPALIIPWVHKSDGQPATQAEIIQDWQTVKNAHKASGSYDAPTDRKITQLKISPLVIQDLTASRMADNEKELVKSLPHFADAPADAQMAVHGMAWAMGGAFIPKDGFKTFADAFNRGDWAAAKAASNFRGAAPQRKAGQDIMFDNAAIVAANKLDPDTLWYPGTAPTTVAGHVVAKLRQPAVVAAVVVGLAAFGGAIYLVTQPAPRRVAS